MSEANRNASRAEVTVVLLAMVLPTIVTWVYFILLDGAERSLQQGAYGLGKAIQFGLPVVWVCVVMREHIFFTRPRPWAVVTGLAFGAAVGLAMAALYFGVLAPSGLFDDATKAARQKVASFGVSSPAAFMLLGLFYSAVHSLLEEYYWRWFVFGRLAAMVKTPTAIALSSVAFAAHHVLVLEHYFGGASPLTWLFTIGVIVGGAVWAWLYKAGESLVAPWLSHALVDAAIFAIGYQMIIT